MRLLPNVRTLLLGGSAVSLLAGCTQASLEDVVSPGDGTPVIVQPITTPGGGTAAAIFAARPTAPTTQADCPSGTVFAAGVALPGGLFSNFCSLTPVSAGVTTAAVDDGTITGQVNVPFSADPILIAGTVFIGDGSPGSAEVTFAPGQTFVTQSAPNVVDLLVVSRGSRLIARGTPNAPIIFTSLQDFLDDTLPNGSSGTGEWGGLAINGAAPLNECTDPSATPGADGCEQSGEGGSGLFGGGDPDDDSGEFEFIRVQHAGFQFTADNELNGVALQGVGRGTLFQNIQVHQGADDGFEWFGGTVDARFLVVTGAADDSFDWTDGWTGRAQFLLAVQGVGDDNGIEGDNNALGNNPGEPQGADFEPRSAPVLSNVTLIGDGSSGEGIELREGVAGVYANIIVTNFNDGFEFDPEGTGPDPILSSVLLADNTVNFTGSPAGAAAALFNDGDNNFAVPTSTLIGVLPGAQELSAVGADPNSLPGADGFFIDGFAGDSADFVGAFGPSETAANNWTTGWTIAIPGAPSPTCPAGTTQATETPTTAGFVGRFEQIICVIDGIEIDGQAGSFILGDVRLTPGVLYRIDGTLFIGQDAGADPANPLGASASLTIDPGVTIFGNQTPNVVDLLVVSRGSQIFVNGSAVAPVVLTSRVDLVNGGVIRTAASGEIGGLAINGRAPLNECLDPSAAMGTVACQQSGEGGSGLFGGATTDDNSGVVNFMQIRYAGFQFTSENELNGIALQGVGNGTELDFIQIINGADDGFEWFGGTVNASHLIVTGAVDDSLDWTDGWTGALQFAIVRQTVGNGEDNGIEGDNNALGNAASDPVNGVDFLPRSMPFLTNITVIGDGASGEGFELRDGTAGAVVNAIVSNFAEGFEFDPEGSGPSPVLSSVLLAGNTTNFSGSPSGAAMTLFNNGDNNVVSSSSFSTLLTPPTGGFVTPLVPGSFVAGLVAANPVEVCASVFELAPATVPVPCNFLVPADYVGAVEDADDRWFAGWTLGL